MTQSFNCKARFCNRICSIGLVICLILSPFRAALAKERAVVYGLAHHLKLNRSNEASVKDYYVGLGSRQGLKPGDFLQVSRYLSTPDLLSAQRFTPFSVPFATLKVIHVEANSAIARLESVTSISQSPLIGNRSILLGDEVRLLVGKVGNSGPNPDQ